MEEETFISLSDLWLAMDIVEARPEFRHTPETV